MKLISEFWKEEDAVGVVEVILILVVLIGLVLIFKKQLVSLVNSCLLYTSKKLPKTAGQIEKRQL